MNPTSASSAASVVTMSGKFSRKSKVAGMYHCAWKSSWVGVYMSVQPGGYWSARDVPWAAWQSTASFCDCSTARW
jgi:hypothetical protein